MVHTLFLFIHIVNLKVLNWIWPIIIRLIFKVNGVAVKNAQGGGRPKIHLSRHAYCEIGDGFACRSGVYYSDTGENRPFVLDIRKNGRVIIGQNVGITSSLIRCDESITIGDDVKIGGGCRIFDTNFHSTDTIVRTSSEDQKHVRTAPVVIGNRVFIGTGCIICKGVTIGENSMIAAGSVVVKDVPANEVWGGNPAKCIKKLFFII